jgi:hypothetical protein
MEGKLHEFHKGKRKSNLITGLDSPCGFQEVEVPRFQDNGHLKLSAICTGRLYPQGNIPGTHFCLEVESAPESQCGRKDYDTLENRTRDLPTCSALPQPIAPPRSPEQNGVDDFIAYLWF